MSEKKEYVSQSLENGSIHINEEVIASIAAAAVQDVDGVYGFGSAGSDLGKLARKANSKEIRFEINEEDEISIDCYIVVYYGYAVIDVAKAAQEAVKSVVESTTGRTVRDVNIRISGITLPKTKKS